MGAESATMDMGDGMSEITALSDHVDDSDEEDEEAAESGDDDTSRPASDLPLVELQRQSPPPSDEMKIDSAEGMSHDAAREEEDEDDGVNAGRDEVDRNVQTKLVHPSSPGTQMGVHSADNLVHGPRKLRVIVKDVAYSTYRAVLHYVSTVLINRCEHFV